MSRVVILHSGGIDSTVLLYKMKLEAEQVRTLSVDYGQTHKREIESARKIADDLGVLHHETFIDSGLFLGSDLTSGDGGVVVPNRNMILISMAGALAYRFGYDTVAVACHQGDHELFPDCRPSFLEEVFRALKRGTDGRVGLTYPFARMSKLEVVKLGVELGVPFERTWSCYEGKDEPCGECLACRERREALFLVGVH